MHKKMVFVGGARQVGKTTLARQILPDDRGPAWQIVAMGSKDLLSADGIRVSPALPFLGTLA